MSEQYDLMSEQYVMLLAEQDKSSQRKKYECLGPYHVESTSSRPITEVKQR